MKIYDNEKEGVKKILASISMVLYSGLIAFFNVKVSFKSVFAENFWLIQAFKMTADCLMCLSILELLNIKNGIIRTIVSFMWGFYINNFVELNVKTQYNGTQIALIISTMIVGVISTIFACLAVFLNRRCINTKGKYVKTTNTLFKLANLWLVLYIIIFIVMVVWVNPYSN